MFKTDNTKFSEINKPMYSAHWNRIHSKLSSIHAMDVFFSLLESCVELCTSANRLSPRPKELGSGAFGLGSSTGLNSMDISDVSSTNGFAVVVTGMLKFESSVVEESRPTVSNAVVPRVRVSSYLNAFRSGF